MTSTSSVTLDQLISGVDGASLIRGHRHVVPSIAYDSRRVEPGGLFVALRGSYVDGHDYLQAALAKGAAACLIDRAPGELELDGFAAVAVAPNSRQALATVARRFYGDPSRDMKLVGITGTDGKTTTSFMAAHLLRRMGLAVGLIGTIDVQIPGQAPMSAGRQTTPESLDTQRLLDEMRAASTDLVILETSSHALETHRVDGCAFDVGVITNITHEHLDFHGSLAAYRRAKARLLDLVRAARQSGGSGVAIINQDDEGALSTLSHATALEILMYGIETSTSTFASAEDIGPETGGYRFALRFGAERRESAIPMPGRWNVSNALAAATICHALGYGIDEISAGLPLLSPIPGRMQAIVECQPFQVIVDYAHTDPALRALLGSVRETTEGKVLVLFGSAGERDLEKRVDMGSTAVELADYALLTSEDPRFEDPGAIIADIAVGALRAGGSEGVDFDRLEDRRLAIEQILQRAEPGDTVILAGKGHERSMIYGDKLVPWDDAGIAREVLKSMGYSASV